MIVNDSNQRRRVVLLLFCVCFVLEAALGPNIAVAGGRIDFMLIFAGCVALSFGGTYGVLCSFGAGLLFDLMTSGPVGAMAFLLTLSSFFLGAEDRDRLADDMAGACRLFFVSAAAVELAYQLCLALTSQQGSFVDVVFRRWLPSTLLDCVVFLPFVFLLSRTGSSGPQLGKKKSGRTRKGSYRIKGL